MNEGKTPPVAEVRVGVHIGRAAVGRPTGVPDPRGTGRDGARLKQIEQSRELARALAHDHFAALVYHRDTSGVVSPIFEALQPTSKHLSRIPRANVSYDSTHVGQFSGNMEGDD